MEQMKVTINEDKTRINGILLDEWTALENLLRAYRIIVEDTINVAYLEKILSKSKAVSALINSDYYWEYKKTWKENEKLRERITYPKVTIKSQNKEFGKKSMYADLLLGDGFTYHRESYEYDAFLPQHDKNFENYLRECLLKELGYKYVKRAYDYWRGKQND